MSRLIGGTLLVAGTTIGAAMLALPVSTGLAGFWPSLLIFLIVWMFMTYSAFLLIEANLWLDEGANLLSMAKTTLGPAGQIFGWVTYLFLLYTLTTAYIAGSLPTFNALLASAMPETLLPHWAGAVPLLGIFGFFVYLGANSVDLVNRVLMAGMVVAYVLLVTLVVPDVEIERLNYISWDHLPIALSVVATSFGFHIIIPTLRTYFHGDVTQLKKAVLIGSCIPVLVYVVWEVVTLGVVPVEGPNGLGEGYFRGVSGPSLLAAILSNPMISVVARAFSFFAIVTSFLGVSLSLFDFLADGLRVRKGKRGRLLLSLLTFVPPLVITFTYPRVFLTALEYAGAFGVVTLLALLPALMVWRGRYIQGRTGYCVPGGRPLLIATMAFAVVVMVVHLALSVGYY